MGYSATALTMNHFGGGLNQWDVPIQNVEPFGIVSQTILEYKLNPSFTNPDGLHYLGTLWALRVFHQSLYPCLPCKDLRSKPESPICSVFDSRVSFGLLCPCSGAEGLYLPSHLQVLDTKSAWRMFRSARSDSSRCSNLSHIRYGHLCGPPPVDM